LKKFLVAALAICSMAAVAAVAVAQTYPLPTLTFDGSLTPSSAQKSGTKKKPKAAKIKLALAIQKEARVTADQITFNLPGDLRVSGSGFKFCPSTELDTTKDPAKCPKGSKVGTGTASAAFGPNLTPINFDIQVFAGSRNELGIWLQAKGLPIAKALRGVVSRAGKPYYQKVTIDIPPELQRQLGAYVYLTGLNATIGGTNGLKGKKKKNLVTTVGCPSDKKHRWEARVRFVPNPNPPVQGQSNQGDTSACRK
jgi:hypothetical protein